MTSKKKAVLISGCDSGFGYSLACHLAEKHVDLITFACCYQHDSEGAKNLRSKGGNIHVLQLDVTQEESVENLKVKIDDILSIENGQLWLLVNNAATLVFADAIWQTRFDYFLVYSSIVYEALGNQISKFKSFFSEMFKNQMDVNLFGCWLMSKVFMPNLMQSHGRLVNMISFCTECPLPTLSLYTSSKAGLLSMSNGMRMELAKYSVDVVLFNPGDYPGETPLCSGQAANYDLMEQEVTQRFGQDSKVMQHFKAYKGKFSDAFPTSPPVKKLDSPGLYFNFDQIITAKKPKQFYVNSDLGTRSFFAFLKWIPVSWSDKLRTAIMRLPK